MCGNFSRSVGAESPRQQAIDIVSLEPASVWHEALVTGNGTMGLMVFGDPCRERVIFNHERLYEPLADEPVAPPEVAGALPGMRRLLLEGKYAEARRHFSRAAHAAGYEGLRWTDPYHPAMAMRIDQPPAGKTSGYRRGVDFDTGEVSVQWGDTRGEFARRCFVSRPRNVAVQRLSSPSGARVVASLRAISQDRRAPSERAQSHHPPFIDADAEFMVYRCKYVHSKRGYLVVTRVVTRGGEAIAHGAEVDLDAEEALLLTRVVSLEDFADADAAEAATRAALKQTPADYDLLMREHAEAHGKLFDRVRLDLGVASAEPAVTEELIARQKAAPERVDPELLQRMFDMGRYSLICSSGEWPPNLMGIFNGDWRPDWSGDFTLDANLNLQVAAANLGGVDECVLAHTRLVEGLVADWRVNARNLFGCEGLLSGARTDGRHNLNTHHTIDSKTGFPGFFWTAGAAWLTHPIHERHLVVGDRRFAEDRLLPLLKGVAEFYFDFLTVEDDNGRLVFAPSYSPENYPSNTGCPVAINATMDIACAKEVFTSLASLCRELGVDPETAERCEAMLARLPPYLINGDGALQEWAWPTLEDRYNHRHVSHLYPVWPGHEINPEDTPELFAAAKVAAAKRGRGNGSAHGLAHMALIGARLKDHELVYGNLRFMLSKNYLLPSLFTYHNPNRIYNADMLHSLPAVVIEMLVYSKPGEIELLPALSPRLPRGTLTGAGVRSRARLDRLSWDLDRKRVEVVLTSSVDQEVRLRLRRGARRVFSDADGELPIDGGSVALVALREGETQTLTLDLP